MSNLVRRATIAVGLAALAGWPVHAATQLVLGRKFQVKNPGGPTARKVSGQALERASNDTLSGDPIASGATLEVIAHGATSSDQTFPMPREGWAPLGTLGYRFSNRGLSTPVKKASVKLTASGVFQIKVLVLGRYGTVDIVPPNPGDEGGFILTITGGDSYCVAFGGSAGGTMLKNDARRWYVRGPLSEACFGTTTSTTTPGSTSTTTASTTTTTVVSSTTTTGASSTTTSVGASTTTTTTASTTTTTTAPACGAPPPSDPVLDPRTDPFYAPPSSITDPPGTILRSREVALAALTSSATTPFSAWQVMYASTDNHDQPAAAIATIIQPCTNAATSPRPLVSYQTAEDSDSLICTPSYRMRAGTEKEETSLPPLLAAGWMVVVPDYEGLLSAYTVGLQAGHAVLDGIRAAENFSASHPELGLGLTGAGTPVGMWGYSGGGLATSWASELAPTYAPELNIVGVAEGGVPPDITAVAKNIDGGVASGIELAGVVGQGQGYPQLLTLLNQDPGQAMRDYFLNNCLEQYIASQYALHHLDEYTTVPDAIDLPWVQQILSFSHLGNVCTTSPFQPCLHDGDCDGGGVCHQKQPAAPIYIYHALNDELIPIREVNALVTQYCTEGLTIDYYQDPASDHNSLAVSGAPAAVEYLQYRFAGQAAPSTCGLPILPPPPTGTTTTTVTTTTLPGVTTTTIPATCGGSAPLCNGPCPQGQVCDGVFHPQTQQLECLCVTGTTACSPSAGACSVNANCPQDTVCDIQPINPPGGCACSVPNPFATTTTTQGGQTTTTSTTTTTVAGQTTTTTLVPFMDCTGGIGFPECNGDCPAGQVCSTVYGNPNDTHDGGCACVIGTKGCESMPGGCTGGITPQGQCPTCACPQGTTCFANPFPGGGCGCFQTGP